MERFWKGLEDGLYSGVVVCLILNSENSPLHKLFANSLPLSECSWLGNLYILKWWFINTLATVCYSLLWIRYTRPYLLKLSSAVSMYRFPLIVSNMETRSMYSFSPTYSANEGTCTLILMYSVIWLSKYHICRIFCLADNRKNLLRNLFNVPSKPLCPPRLLWWNKFQTSITIDSRRHIRHTSPIHFILAALVNISTLITADPPACVPICWGHLHYYSPFLFYVSQWNWSQLVLDTIL